MPAWVGLVITNRNSEQYSIRTSELGAVLRLTQFLFLYSTLTDNCILALVWLDYEHRCYVLEKVPIYSWNKHGKFKLNLFAFQTLQCTRITELSCRFLSHKPLLCGSITPSRSLPWLFAVKYASKSLCDQIAFHFNEILAALWQKQQSFCR